MAKTSRTKKEKSSLRKKPNNRGLKEARKSTTHWFVSPLVSKKLKLNFPPMVPAPEIALMTEGPSWQHCEGQRTPDFDTSCMFDVVVRTMPSPEETPLSSLPTDRISRKKLFRSSTATEFRSPFDKISLGSDVSFEERHFKMLARENDDTSDEEDSRDVDYRTNMRAFASIDSGRYEGLFTDSEATPLHQPHRGKVGNVGSLVFVPETPENELGFASCNSCVF